MFFGSRVGSSVFVVLCAVAPACRSVPEDEVALPPGSSREVLEGDRPPVLGLAVERAPDGSYRLVDLEAERRELRRGTRSACEEALVQELEERFGRGRPNVPFPTLGGRQFWADRFWFSGWRIQENVVTGHHRLLDPSDTRHAWGSYEACRTRFERERRQRALRPTGPHVVVLVHGLFRSKGSLRKLRRELSAAGYDVLAFTYPSTRRSIEEHAASLEQLLNRLEGAERVSFVTHSLGGLVVRAVFAREGAWRERIEPSRAVFLAPPSRGSAVAESLDAFLPFAFLAGPSALELAVGRVTGLPIPPCELGIIAGGKGDGRGFNPLLPGDDDGIVTVEEARLPGATDFLVVDAAHTFLMNHPSVVEATLRFLESGRFTAR